MRGLARVSLKYLEPESRIRVLVVDDSVVIRRLVTQALSEDKELDVVGAAANGAIALQRIEQLKPDAITLDIEMPEMDGLEALRRIRKLYPEMPVIMFSTLTERGASATLEALSLGASDYVTKAANVGSLDKSMTSLRLELVPKIKQFFAIGGASVKTQALPEKQTPIRTVVKPAQGHFTKLRKIVAIGVSTGGPAALGTVLPMFPKDFPLPIVIVQHMPPLFTRLLAERLNAECAIEVEEAKEAAALTPGKALIAAGGYHLCLRKKDTAVLATLNQDAAENSCRPAVDVTFRSIAELYGGATIAVMLTGMGQDGLRGTEHLKKLGAYVIAQDEHSSIVWGMPGNIVNSGLADAVVDLTAVVPEILKHF